MLKYVQCSTEGDYVSASTQGVRGQGGRGSLVAKDVYKLYDLSIVEKC